MIRIVELGASFAHGPFSRKLDLAESHVREMNMKYKCAMKIPAQVMIKRLNRILTQHIVAGVYYRLLITFSILSYKLIACGMNLDPGATALRNAMAELKPGLEQFNKKLLMEA